MPESDEIRDLLIVGGGVNGCGIARDAAGRGLSVTLAEMGDLAQATSSASTKLFHGGLRYLEYFEFRLVREALRERETLLRAMPHIAWPMRFVLPYSRDMRFDSDSPTSRLLGMVMPWMRGRRPGWLIRLGLFLYDHLGGRQTLPGTATLKLPGTPEGDVLQDRFTRAYEYSDCWVQDSRLVVLNARDAQARGARILTRHKVVSATQSGGIWTATLRDSDTGAEHQIRARMIVNAAGPWVEDLLRNRAGLSSRDGVRLVRGSHIVTRRLFDHDKCYFFQGTDGRIMFAIPYEGDFTLIGTTDCEHDDPDTPPVCTEVERDYMLDFVNAYLREPVTADDIVWSYSGVRPLYDDAASSATAATRDYVLRLDNSTGAPLLTIFGGKITTYRRLAEQALGQISEALDLDSAAWTSGAPLPGGDFPVESVDTHIARLEQDYPFLNHDWAQRLFRAYGTEARLILGAAQSTGDLGQDFGASLTQAEIDWLMDHEFARRAEDVLWRRGKLGLRISAPQAQAIEDYMQNRLGATQSPRAATMSEAAQ